MRRQRGFAILVYALAGLAILAALSAIAYKVRQSGFDACRVEWDAANAAASEKAEADRKRQDLLSRAEATRLEAALQKQKRVSRDLQTVAEAHIRAARLPSECVLSPDLLRDWNRANKPAAKDDASGSMPDAGGTPAASNRRNDGRDAAKPPDGG